jgi:hypothetical protein
MADNITATAGGITGWGMKQNAECRLPNAEWKRGPRRYLFFYSAFGIRHSAFLAHWAFLPLFPIFFQFPSPTLR